MAFTKKPYLGLTGGWLTFWLTVRLLQLLTTEGDADKSEFTGSMCYRHDAIWI